MTWNDRKSTLLDTMKPMVLFSFCSLQTYCLGGHSFLIDKMRHLSDLSVK